MLDFVRGFKTVYSVARPRPIYSNFVKTDKAKCVFASVWPIPNKKKFVLFLVL